MHVKPLISAVALVVAFGAPSSALAASHSHGRRPRPTPAPAPAPTPTPTPTPAPTGSEVDITAYVTSYGWPDNSPPGDAISNPVIHQTAGGTGTYADPITLAVAYSGSTLEYAAGTSFYIPNVRRYFIVEDTCSGCYTHTPSGDTAHVDMWVGGDASSSTSDVENCEDDLTGSFLIIENPADDYAVVPGSLFTDPDTCSAQYGNTLVTTSSTPGDSVQIS